MIPQATLLGEQLILMLSEQLSEDVAAVVRVIAYDGSDIHLNATGPTADMFAEGGDDPMHRCTSHHT